MHVKIPMSPYGIAKYIMHLAFSLRQTCSACCKLKEGSRQQGINKVLLDPKKQRSPNREQLLLQVKP